MAQQALSPSWYRVAELRPRLRSHFRIHRHQYRGGRWYVLQDRMSRRSHRFDARAYFVIGMMDGQRSMQSIWDAAVERYGDEAPTQEEMIRLLGQLHLADIVQCEATPDVDELLRRTHRISSRTRLARWMAPLAIKIPLFDPDRLLERWLPWYRPLFGPVGALVWLALVLWLELQPGIPRAVLFNVMLIAGVSTVLFNANPLLRFDGYYILADLLEIPNLRQRAQQYLASIFERRLFGLEVPLPDANLRERAWLLFFAVASFLYRISITISIAAFVATQYFIIGILLAISAVIAGVVLPIGALLNYLAFSPRLRRYRVRAVGSSLALGAVLLALVFLLPVPSWTNAQGVIWDAEQSSVRGATDGFVTRVIAVPGARVSRGEVLVEAVDPMLPPRIRMLEARKSEFEARYYAERVDSLVKAQMTLESMKAADAELRRAQERAAELVMRSPSDGVFVLQAPGDLPGRYVRQGELVGYVIPEGGAAARVVVPQQSADLVRAKTERVTVKLAERLGETFAARIVREVPRAVDRVPSMALAQAGGGDIALDPGATR